MSILLAMELTAALLARYEYQPPKALSLMLPTRADMRAKTADLGKASSNSRGVLLRGSKEVKCFDSKRGPRVLICKLDRASAALIWAGDFSGCKMPGMQKASRRYVSEKRALQCEAAALMLASSTLELVLRWKVVIESATFTCHI